MADIVKLIYKGDEMVQWGGSASVDPATTTTVGTVRVATTSEFNNWTEKWSNDEYLLATVPQIRNRVSLKTSQFNEGNIVRLEPTAKWDTKTANVILTSWALITVNWTRQVVNGQQINYVEIPQATKISWSQYFPGKNWDTNSSNYYETLQELYYVSGSWYYDVSYSFESDWSYTWNDVVSSAKRMTISTTQIRASY